MGNITKTGKYFDRCNYTELNEDIAKADWVQLLSGSPAVLAFFENECFFLIFSRVLVSTGKTRFPFDDSLIVFVGICLSSIFIIMS
jgi:hypothetical protein